MVEPEKITARIIDRDKHFHDCDHAWTAGFLVAIAGAVKSGVDPTLLHATVDCAGITEREAREAMSTGVNIDEDTIEIIERAGLFIIDNGDGW